MRNTNRRIDDAVLDLDSIKKNRNMVKRYDRARILDIIQKGNPDEMEALSEYYYQTNGIYSRTCNYFAQMYRYDWYTVPETYGKVNTDKVVQDWKKLLTALDNSYIKKSCMDIASEVIRKGAYYCYISRGKDNRILLQSLPKKYCRCRYSSNGVPVIDFNMKYFDDAFNDPAYRVKVIKMFSPDFQRGYVMYKEGRLKGEWNGDTAGWYPLEPGTAWKFNFDNNDRPLFLNAILALEDLEQAQALDRKKQLQKLLKIIIQKLPTDKNGDLLFDIDEALDLHQNAVEMLSNAIGVDVLTTFADIKDISVSDERNTTATDELERNERAVYNAFGVAQGLFNAEGNISLANSVLNDEGYMRTFLLQLSMFYDWCVQSMSTNPKKYNFRLYMLETTQYNYKELSKMYKEQMQTGHAKMLPQIALGHSQSFILNSCYFENEILKLYEIMIPPLMSSTMNSDTILGKNGQGSSSNSQVSTEEKKNGRPEKPETEKSDKTIANENAQG